MKPANYVIDRFGGIRPLARALGHRSHTTVQRWAQRGYVPAIHQARILELAEARGIDLRAEDLIAGRSAGKDAA